MSPGARRASGDPSGTHRAAAIGGKDAGMVGELHPVVRGIRPTERAHGDHGGRSGHRAGGLGRGRADGRNLDPAGHLRGLAVIVDEATPAAQVAALIRQSGGKLLVDLRLFDVYRGGQFAAGKKSLAYSLTFQAADRTLTDEDTRKLRAKIVGRLERELGATLRA